MSFESELKVIRRSEYHCNRGYSQESLHPIFQSKSLDFSFGYLKDKNDVETVDVFKILRDWGYFSSLRTRRST